MTATLPDLTPLRALPIPDTEPPPEPYAGRVRTVGRGQPTLALAAVTTPRPARPPYRALGPFGPYGQLSQLGQLGRRDQQGRLGQHSQPGQFGPRATATDELPDPQAWARRMAQAVIEVLSGVRPMAQLVRWTSLEVYAGLQRRCAPSTTLASPERRAVVRTVRVCLPADGVVEASAVVVARGRVQAVALRLEGIDGRWRMTALELG